VSYRHVTLQPALPTDTLQQQWLKEQQQKLGGAGESRGQQQQHEQQEEVLQHVRQVPSLLGSVMESVAAGLGPESVCHVMQVGPAEVPKDGDCALVQLLYLAYFVVST
jgi:hypothetical protein